MTNYVEELLTTSSPANNNLFQHEETSALLSKEDREYFHTTVAQLLYLAKRIRPDILLSVSYLTTRMREPSEKDLGKLNRGLKYINGTEELSLCISAYNVLNISAYIDASYGTHNDYKSHSGV